MEVLLPMEDEPEEDKNDDDTTTVGTTIERITGVERRFMIPWRDTDNIFVKREIKNGCGMVKSYCCF